MYYLATEHANHEVGPGKEAYNVKVGGQGVPLVGDDSPDVVAVDVPGARLQTLISA